MKLSALFFIVVCNSSLSVAATLDYGRDIQPILSEHCFHCHGSDEKSRKGELRLDVRELGTIYLGGVSLRDLHLAGLVEESTPGAVANTARAFAAYRAPFCPDPF